MRRIDIAVSLVLAAISAAPALAGDPLAKGNAAFDWSGGYIGAQTGYVGGQGHFFGSGDHSAPEPDGFLGGLYTGVNYQFSNNAVIGIDADIAWTGAKDSALVYDSAGIAWPAAYSVVQEINWTGAVRGRIGYAMDRWLPYIAGGVAFADVSQQLLGADGNFDKNYLGWTVGAGAEYAVTDNVILRADYRFADFGSKTFEVPGASPLNISLKTHSARLGIAFKF